MGFNLIFIGFLFTVIPGIGIVDIVPDFIGWMLIARGLNKLCYTEAKFSLARRYAFYLVGVTAAKFALMFTVGLVDNTMLLVYCFSFAALDIYLSLTWASGFFSGCEFTMNACDSPVIKLVSEAKFMFTVAVIARTALTALPEFFTLADPSVSGEYSPSAIISADVFPLVRNIARLAGFAGALGIGIYCAVKLSFFFKLCRLDKSYGKHLQEKYEKNFLNNPSFRISTTVKSALNLISIGVFFLIGLYIDKINVIPSTVFFVLAFIGLRQMKKVIKVKKGAITLAIVGIFVSVGTHAVQIFYGIKYVGDYDKVFSGAVLPKLFGSLNLLISAALLIYIILLVNRIARDYIKAAPAHKGRTVFLINSAKGKTVLHTSSVGTLCAYCTLFAILLTLANAVAYILPITGSLFMTLTALFGLIFGAVFMTLTGKITSYEVWNI